MNVFRELHIDANADRMAEIVAELEKELPDGWTRDTAAESRTNAFAFSTKRVTTYCFACKSDRHRPAAMLILAQKDALGFHVSNIIPTERHQLEHSEYNGVLEEFIERILKPFAARANLIFTVTAPEAGPEQWMDEETAELLRSFSANANKGTGASHPSDWERWNTFVLSAYRNNCELDPSTLARWLVEAEGWSPEVAEQLALEYESGRGLLDYAFAH